MWLFSVFLANIGSLATRRLYCALGLCEKPRKFGMSKTKTVKVEPETHRRLAQLGHTLDDMDSIVVKLLDFWDTHHGEEGASQ